MYPEDLPAICYYYPMNIFVAASYSAQVDYATGKVFPAYRDWLEEQLTILERAGYQVFCALRADGYAINQDDPAAAFRLDMEELQACDALLAFLDDAVSAGVQTEIGIGVALGKRVILAHAPDKVLGYFNGAMVRAGMAQALSLPLTSHGLQQIFR